MTIGGGSAGGIKLNTYTLTVSGSGNQTYGGSISGSGGLNLTGGFLVLTSATTQSLGGLPAPYTSSNFGGNIIVSGGTLEAAAFSTNYGSNGVFGQCSNSSSRTITVNSGGTILFLVPNVFGLNGAISAPTLDINGGLVTNMSPLGLSGTNSIVNNALNNITLSGGTLSATTGESNPTGGYGSWDINGSVTSTLNSLISSSDPIYGNVMLSVVSQNNHTTTFNVQSGTLTISAIVVDDHRNSSSNIAGLNLTGSGLLLLTASNGYNGGTTVGGGTLQVGNLNALGSGGLTANAGLVDLNGNSIGVTTLGGTAGTITDQSSGGGTTTLTVSETANASTSFSGAINDGASRHLALAMTGPGTLFMAGTSTYTGGTTIANGILQLGSSSALGSGSLTLNGGVLDLNGNPLGVLSLGGSAGEITDNSSTGGTTTLTVVQGGNSTFGGSIMNGFNSQPLAVVKTGTGQLVLTNLNNNYIGPTTVNGGTLQLGNGAAGNDGALTATSGVTDNATLVYNLYGSQTVNYAISGTGSLTKTGTGLLNLALANSYSGGTTLNSGTLQVGAAGAIPSGPGAGDVTVSTSGVLDLAGNLTNINGLWGGGIVDDSVGGGTLAVGNNGDASTFSGTIQNSTGPVSLEIVGGTLTLTGTNTYLGGTTVSNGKLIVTNSKAIEVGTDLYVGTELLLFGGVVPAQSAAPAADPRPASGCPGYPTGIAPVPEPCTLALLATAGLFLLLLRRSPALINRE